MELAHSITPAQNDNRNGSGARLVSSDGSQLPLKATHLEVRAEGGIARAVLTQTFVNDRDKPLRVRYLLPLPSDGAVSGFSFTIGENRIIGEVDKKQAARERFEEAIASGKAAAILDQERSNTFAQEVGNIPAGETVHCEVVVDQPLAWLAEGAWEWRFPTVVGPRYSGEPGRVKDAHRIEVPVADGKLGVQATLELSIGDAITGDVGSPSHALTSRDDSEDTICSLKKSASLDRDLVVRWPVARPAVGLSINAARPSSESHGGDAYALITVVPPAPSAKIEAVARDLIVLIDTSGSMSGQPLAQAKRVVGALIDSLGGKDRLELIEFSSRPSRWRPEPVVATRDGKKAAQKWVKKLSAGGGTEMREGILEALRPLRNEAQRQVVLITDGYIGFEAEIIETVVNRLPASCRIHTVGVGSGINRALTEPVAKAGGGVELIVSLGEDVEPLIERLLKRTAKPVVTELEIGGDAVIETASVVMPDLYAESPALLAVKVAADGGTLTVRGRAGEGLFEREVRVERQLLGSGNQGVVALFGREQVEAWETRLAAGTPRAEVDENIEELGLSFQIATRLTSWVAIGEDKLVDTTPESVEMPHELPYGTSAEGFGLRSARPEVRMQLTSVSEAAASFGAIAAVDEMADLDEEFDGEAMEPPMERTRAGVMKTRHSIARKKAESAPGSAPRRGAPAPAAPPKQEARKEAEIAFPEPVEDEPMQAAPQRIERSTATMAERLAPRKRPSQPRWWWIIALLVLAALLYILFGVLR